MSAVIDVALPVFAVMLTGFVAGRTGVLGSAAGTTLNAYVYWFALPPLLFLSLARKPLAEAVNPPFTLAFLGALVATAALAAMARKLRRPETPSPELVQHALNASFPNTGNMGIPLFLAAFGPLGVAPAILATLLVSSVVIGGTVVAVEAARSRGAGMAAALIGTGRTIATNPLILAPLLGMLVSGLGLTVPAPVQTYGDLMGATMGPCALFGIGLFLAGQKVEAGGLGGLARMLATAAEPALFKLLLQPLIAWVLVTWLVPLDAFWTASLLILSALPTGALSFVFASRYGILVERTSAAILVTTALSMATVSALLAWLLPVGR